MAVHGAALSSGRMHFGCLATVDIGQAVFYQAGRNCAPLFLDGKRGIINSGIAD